MPEIPFYSTRDELESLIADCLANGDRLIWAGGSETQELVEVFTVQDFGRLIALEVPDSGHFYMVPREFAKAPIQAEVNRFNGKFYFYPKNQPLNLELIVPIEDKEGWLSTRRGFFASPPPSVSKKMTGDEKAVIQAAFQRIKKKLFLGSKSELTPDGTRAWISTGMKRLV